MGSEDADINPADGEAPIRAVVVAPFRIDAVAVTNARFAAFVRATGYRTDAERYGWSFVFRLLLPPGQARSATHVVDAPWWMPVPGASWRTPEGPGSNVGARRNHPVVHVSWHDAVAFCGWAGTRLPSEREWEFAARGGLEQARYPWGDVLAPHGQHRCNIWQGDFPAINTLDDGHLGTAPVKEYRPNGYGLFNMVGNVWEWTSDRFSTSSDGDSTAATSDLRAMRGGSYLCHSSYCNRYRVAARTSNSPDSSAGNIGFRIAADSGDETRPGVDTLSNLA